MCILKLRGFTWIYVNFSQDLMVITGLRVNYEGIGVPWITYLYDLPDIRKYTVINVTLHVF